MANKWVTIAAIAALAAVGISAEVCNHDGNILMGLVSIITGLAGYHIGTNTKGGTNGTS